MFWLLTWASDFFTTQNETSAWIYLITCLLQKYTLSLSVWNFTSQYRQTPISAVSVIRGLLWPENFLENWRNKQFISFKTRAVTWWDPAAQMHPVLDSSSFVPVPTLPCKLATILLLAFSLFKLVATLWQCLCSESNKKNGEVGEYPQ